MCVSVLGEETATLWDLLRGGDGIPTILLAR